MRIRIGDPNRLVPPGIHTYTIRYLTWWQVSFGPDEDGLDWNVTGNGWNRPIDPVRREVAPGMLGSSHGYPAFFDVVTTGPLSIHEGLTVAASFPKGVLQQPSQLQVAVHWAGDNLAVFPSLLGVVWIAFYVGWLFLYGAARPPAVIVPQFAPPSGFSPAMVGYPRTRGCRTAISAPASWASRWRGI